MREWVRVQKSKFGRGVFASRDFKKGDKILTLKGKSIAAERLNQVSKLGRNILVDPLQISDRKFLIMREPYVLISHSCSPNAGIKRGFELFALRKINKGEEIFFDYSSVWFEGFACACGSPNCRTFVSDFTSLSKARQKAYLKLGIVPDFIKRKVEGRRSRTT